MSIIEKDVAAYLENNLVQYLEILESWVGINSFTTNSAGVNHLGKVTADRFSKLSFDLERVPSQTAEFGDHFVLTRKGSGRIKIGLISHLDTVFPEGEEQDNAFSWRVEGDRVFGPGTVDIKGGTLVIYMMLDALRQFAPDVFEAVTWVIMLDASEETLSEDFGSLCLDRLAGANACLVFEGGLYNDGMFKVVRSRKGMAKFRIRVEGRAAHAGVAHADGANAIVQLAEAVQKIASFTDYEREITFNVGVADGGTVPNRVPHLAHALGEMRAFDNTVFAEGLKKLESLAEDGMNGSGCKVFVEVFDITAPWPGNVKTDELISVWSGTAEGLGYRVIPEARGGLSDGNHTWQHIPTLDGLGVGGGNAHCSEHLPEMGKEQEYLYLPSIVPKTVLNTLALIALVSRAESR